MFLPFGREEGPSDLTGLSTSRRGGNTENWKGGAASFLFFLTLEPCLEPYHFCRTFPSTEGRDHSSNIVIGIQYIFVELLMENKT